MDTPTGVLKAIDPKINDSNFKSKLSKMSDDMVEFDGMSMVYGRLDSGTYVLVIIPKK